MPALTRWFIKTSFLYLLAALLAGIAQAMPPASADPWVRIAAGTAFVHLLTVGWLTQMIFGVAHWMFPRHSRDRPLGSEALGWCAYVLLNAGLVLRAAHPAGVWGAALVISAAAQWGAAAAFAWNTWPRVREK